MWRKKLGPCTPNVVLAQQSKFAAEKKKRTAVKQMMLQKEVVLGNSKTQFFTFKMTNSLRGHNAKQVLKTSNCCFYHGWLEVRNHVVTTRNYMIYKSIPISDYIISENIISENIISDHIKNLLTNCY